MDPGGLDSPFPVATYGFNVPCRKFLVTASVTSDRRLAMMDEFALRLLKLGERLPVRRLARFMGLSDDEISAVVNDLVQRGLVELGGDYASLHPSADAYFRGVGGGVPQILEVDTWIEHVWFELVSKGIVTPGEERPAPNLVAVRAPPGWRELPAALAKKAFEEGFADYLVKVRRINNPDRISLYAVSEIVAGRYGSIAFESREFLSLSPRPRLDTRLLEDGIDKPPRRRPLTDALSEALSRLDHPAPSGAALADYSRLLGGQAPGLADGRGSWCDLPGWIRDEAVRSGGPRRPLVGNSYVPRNIEAFVRVAGARWRGQRGASGAEAGIVWLRLHPETNALAAGMFGCMV